MADAVDCYDVARINASAPSGVYSVRLGGGPPLSVYCNMTGDANNRTGWTVMQRRMDGSVDFNRTWAEYQSGFGNLSTEFWMEPANTTYTALAKYMYVKGIYTIQMQVHLSRGNDNLAVMTAGRQYELQVNMGLPSSKQDLAVYSHFVIGNATTNYQLMSVGTYRPGCEYDLLPHVGAPFSTYDVDNYNGGAGCNISFRGAWWYQNCVNISSVSCGGLTFSGCQYANLNGQYGAAYGLGIVWISYSGYSLSYAQMMLVPMIC